MRWTRTISAFAVIAGLVAFGSFVRIDTAFSLPEFDKLHAEGMLKSDPGLLYYLTQSVVEAGGRAPPDFRADPRVEHPLESDLPAMFTVGPKFVLSARKSVPSPVPSRFATATAPTVMTLGTVMDRLSGQESGSLIAPYPTATTLRVRGRCSRSSLPRSIRQRISSDARELDASQPKLMLITSTGALVRMCCRAASADAMLSGTVVPR